MNLDTAFTLELLLVVALIAAFLGAFLLVVSNRRTRRETGRQVRTADIPGGPELGEPEGRSRHRPPPASATRVLQEDGSGDL